MNYFFRRAWLIAAVPSTLAAQEKPASASGPPVEAITTASAVSSEPLGSITGVRELPGGRVLVNDGTRRRLLLMDTTLQILRVVLDSLTDVQNSYGTRPGALIPFVGDSTLFVDPASYAMLVIDPAGTLARVRSVWRVQDLPFLTSPGMGWPGVDANGRVVYRIAARAAAPRIMSPASVPFSTQEPDSAFIVAVNLATRAVDTLGSLRTPKTASTTRRMQDGRVLVDGSINPLPSSDDWAVLPDGGVAFVRARDYRVEFLNPDGSRASSPRLPFEWQRLTDEDKQRMVDSVAQAQRKSALLDYTTAMIRWTNQSTRPYPGGFMVPEGYAPPPGFGRDWKLPPGVQLPADYVYACAPGEQPQMKPRAGTEGPPTPSCIPPPVTMGAPAAPVIRHAGVIAPSDLPDYRPPITAGGSVRADRDGNLWIRVAQPRPIPGGPVFDIVNRQGEIVTRFQLPQGYSLVGFGQGKVVYLSMRDATGIHLARVRLR